MGQAVRGSGLPAGGALIPVIKSAIPHQIVPDRTGGKHLSAVGPAAVYPSLYRNRGGTTVPEGRDVEFSVIAVFAGQSPNHAANSLRCDLHRLVLF